MALWLLLTIVAAAANAASLTIDYPQPGTVFPPDFAPPTFIWRDSSDAARWQVEIRFAGGSPVLRRDAKGDRLEPGPADPRAAAATNEPPRLAGDLAGARTWQPDTATWAEIRERSVSRPAFVTISGYRDDGRGQPLSRGSVSIQTSKDPVGAPIFYRDVPLMPSELEKGVIKPLTPAAVPLIAWRLRNVAEPRSRLLMEGLHTSANCHSSSPDGKTMGMDLDGPQNDKGLYAILPVQPRMTIRNEDMVRWSSFRRDLGPDLRVGFMSQVSPDGSHVVTMIDRPAASAEAGGNGPRGRAGRGRGHFYVANFKDYRFLQVFYPTRGILAWYSRAAGRLQPLPGADDPRYVHTNAVWTPDGKQLVFARAEAREPYPPNAKRAERANDPNETPIRYDLYRIPFNGGRGGAAVPISGASKNGMSNSFPKVSPDGRWIVFVQARNGQLMRPDSQLYIVPANGGTARKLNANLALMNSWHSFSPNGRWLVFSSKARSPYTQMYLTHLDEDGRDSPPVLVENSTAANRAVNIPEFVNIPPEGMLKIEAPAVEYYKQFDLALDLVKKGRYAAAVAEWRKAAELASDDSKVYMNLGVSLAGTGEFDEAIRYYTKALEIDPRDPEILTNYGAALAGAGRHSQGLEQYEKALSIDPEYAEAHNNLGLALAGSGRIAEAIEHYRAALESKPEYAAIHNNLGAALARAGKAEEAAGHFQKFLELNPDSVEVHGNLIRALSSAGRSSDIIGRFENLLRLHPRSAPLHNTLGVALGAQKRADEAIACFRKALEISPGLVEAHLNLGDALFSHEGNSAEALAHWREVLRAAPNQVPVLNQAAFVSATDPDESVRNGAEAVRLAERAAQLSGDRQPAVLDTLAAAYAEAGRFPEAVETARRAMAIAAAQGRSSLVEAVKARLALYEANQPYRRPK